MVLGKFMLIINSEMQGFVTRSQASQTSFFTERISQAAQADQLCPETFGEVLSVPFLKTFLHGL